MTTLDPDGLEKAAEAIWRRESDVLERKVYEFASAPSRLHWVNCARAAVAAYLDAQTVTTVEELDALPDLSAVVEDDGIVCVRNGYDMDGNTWYAVGDVIGTGQVELPARVIYRPAS